MTHVLQIIHIADLHVFTESSSTRRVAMRSRRLARVKNNLTAASRPGTRNQVPLETNDVYFTAGPANFSKFLRDLRSDDPDWFDSTPTWLLDTGDRTAFGDEASIEAGWNVLKEWADLTGAKVRTLYGNQDASVSPPHAPANGAYFANLAKQYQCLTDFPGWQPKEWTSEPLRAPLPIKGDAAYLELYGLDTVAWEGLHNQTAIGEIRPTAITRLQDRIDQRRARGNTEDYRILATHYPINFPYPAIRPPGCRDSRTMRLVDSKKITTLLSPYVDLIVSGHVHRRYPGGHLSVHGETAPHRAKNRTGALQLTCGALMLNVDPALNGAAHPADEPQPSGPAGFDNLNCQADILRFSIEPYPGKPSGPADTLVLRRLPIVGSAGLDYVIDMSRAQLIPLKRF